MDFHYSSQQNVEDDTDGTVQHYLPVVCTGRQPGSDVFVVGTDLHFNSDGSRIAPDMQQYIWIPEILHKLHVDKISAPLTMIPEVLHPLRKLLKCMSRVSGDNFVGSIYMLSEFIIGVFHWCSRL